MTRRNKTVAWIALGTVAVIIVLNQIPATRDLIRGVTGVGGNKFFVGL